MTLLPTLSLLVLAFATPLLAQAPESPGAADARHGIEVGNAAYIAAFSRADARALSQVYDAEGARLNDGGVVVRGRSAIAADVGKFVRSRPRKSGISRTPRTKQGYGRTPSTQEESPNAASGVTT